MLVRNLVIIAVLLLLLRVILFPSTGVVRSVSPWICPGAVYEVKTEKPWVALTIDDGPNPDPMEQTTQDILGILSKDNVSATWFLIGSHVEQKGAIVEEMVSQGQELGNHLTYDEASIKLGNRFESDLLRTQKILNAYDTHSWMRPGVGFCTAKMITIAQKHGYSIALGSIFPYDTLITSSRFTRWFIGVNLRRGAIIILHDGKNQRGKRTSEALRGVLEMINRRGYKVVNLSTLLEVGEPLSSKIPLVQPVVDLIREPLIVLLLSTPRWLMVLLGMVISIYIYGRRKR
ncbi:polysaccharide deacetylase family protein [Gloeocapsa sp. PCC 73106]|uniref:polysaccharide deacetylase family protein n=1 Tax=Gloeocapsa sp. PCC 73106 TaxID=102232 RepID=UPI0002AC5294|nr:polysaccharide deacetylase family protein [Gloeocapsa sp. PCC 73106]ELR99995.1 putative xylanase/chitin deacetylase [Gloeocapsa sp. PCC 73106]